MLNLNNFKPELLQVEKNKITYDGKPIIFQTGWTTPYIDDEIVSAKLNITKDDNLYKLLKCIDDNLSQVKLDGNYGYCPLIKCYEKNKKRILALNIKFMKDMIMLDEKNKELSFNDDTKKKLWKKQIRFIIKIDRPWIFKDKFGATLKCGKLQYQLDESKREEFKLFKFEENVDFFSKSII